jgi:hypothetical protein
MLLTRQGISLYLAFVIVQKCTTSLGPSNAFLSRCSCMSPCRWDYIFTTDVQIRR